MYQSHTLRLADIRMKDKGVYICVADNNVIPADIMAVKVNVIYRPQCTSVTDRVGQVQNRRLDATLECKVSGRCCSLIELLWDRFEFWCLVCCKVRVVFIRIELTKWNELVQQAAIHVGQDLHAIHSESKKNNNIKTTTTTTTEIKHFRNSSLCFVSCNNQWTLISCELNECQ